MADVGDKVDDTMVSLSLAIQNIGMVGDFLASALMKSL
jgi:hypothetical protein